MNYPLSSGPIAVNLRRLFPTASYVGCGDIRVTSLCADSRECTPGALYVALRGTRHDGHDHIQDAVQQGARAILVERPQAGVRVPQCVIHNTRTGFGELCAAIEGDPSHWMQLVGVTGTNGKTTISWLVRAIVQNAGRACGLLGTIEYSDGVDRAPSCLTTPDSQTLSRWLGRMLRQRTEHGVMEVSSHALEQERLAGTWLDVAIISNITQDHLDYHETFENYRQAKQRILERLKPTGLTILNADDPASLACRSLAPHRVRTYGIETPADYSAEILQEGMHGTQFLLRAGVEELEVSTSLIGRHNVSNCLAAIAAAEHLGFSLEQGVQGIESLEGIPGRMERISLGQPFGVFVDYAHTDDALRRAIHALQQLTIGRVIVVYGAGGDRDRTKRPLMGLAGASADLAIVTSDNPRSENPHVIIEEILQGFDPYSPTPVIEVDREAAIRRGLLEAQPDDCVLISGKGHETTQVIGSEQRAFDDRDVVRRCLRQLRLTEHTQLMTAGGLHSHLGGSLQSLTHHPRERSHR